MAGGTKFPFSRSVGLYVLASALRASAFDGSLHKRVCEPFAPPVRD